jgi:hypothetical protein
MAQTIGFATGGYLAGRLRSPAFDGVIGERTFRDAAQGFMVWAIGVVAMMTVAGVVGMYAAGATAQVAAGLASGMGGAGRGQETSAGSTPGSGGSVEYFVDTMFRPAPGQATAGQAPSNANDTATVGRAAGAQPLSSETRAEATRILTRSAAQGHIDDADKTYLAQVVSARTGLPPDEAQRRVAETEAKARENAK